MTLKEMKRCSKRTLETHPPIMQTMKDLASREDVIDLSQGIPAIEPPREAIERVVSNLDSIHRYGPDGGDPDLKEVVSLKLIRENDINANPDENIMITAGANMGFLLAISSICDVGDEVALVDPYYFNHQMTLDILGVRAIHVPTDAHYMPNLAFLESAIGPRTRAVVIVSPNNPTGVVYPKKLIVEIVELCSQRGIVLISDETYEHFAYDTSHFSPASIEDPKSDVISLFSFSKSYGISGWRVGYAVFPEFLNESMLKVQDTSSICAPRISQRLALELLKGEPPIFGKYMNDLMKSRQHIISFLDKASDLIEAPTPQGAFYSLPRSKARTPAGGNSMDLVVRILEKCRVLVVPGDPFGAGSLPSFRISYGNVSCEMLNEALQRMERNLPDLLG